MDEAYLTGEPFEITKTRGSRVISAPSTARRALTVRATARAVDSRYAKITGRDARVRRIAPAASPSRRPTWRRLHAGRPAIAVLAWAVSGSATRFLAVLVIATAVSAADCDSGGHHRLDLAVRPAIDHRPELGRARTDHCVPNGDFRQDRDADVWSAVAHRTCSSHPGSIATRS
jgi:hypothetical protein